MYITPPALTIIDDYDPPIRTQGLDILSQLVDRLSLRTLKNTGAFELFMTVSLDLRRQTISSLDLFSTRHYKLLSLRPQDFHFQSCRTHSVCSSAC